MPTAAFTINDNTQCLTGNSVQVTDASTNGSGTINTWAWSTAGGSPSSFSVQGPNTTSYATSGNKTINLTVTDDNGCSNSTAYSNNVTIYAMPTAGAITGSAFVCAGGSQLMTSNASGGTAPYSYSWNTSNSSAVSLTNSNSATKTVNGSSSGGTSNITYSVTDANSCSVTSANFLETVVAVQPLAFTVSVDTVYYGQTGVTFTVPLDPLADYYSWTFSGSGGTLNAPTNTNSITLDMLTAQADGLETISVYAHTNSPVCMSPARSKNVYVSDEVPWRGYTNDDWNTGSNWAGLFVPTPSNNVLIPQPLSVLHEQPHTNGFTPTVRNLRVASGGILNITNGDAVTVKKNLNLAGKIIGDYLKLENATSVAHSLSGNGRVDKLELNDALGAIITSGDFGVKKEYKPTSGVLTTNGHLRLCSDVNATASVLAPPSCTGNYIDGIVTCEKWIHGGRRAYRFIGHPFKESKGLNMLTDDIDITGNGGSTNGFTPSGTNNSSAFFFNTWIASNNTTNDLLGWVWFATTNGTGQDTWWPGQGVRILVRGAKGEGLDGNPYTPSPATLTMPGNLNQCDTTYHLGSNGNNGMDGFNLICNPYPSNIDLSLTTRGDSVGECFWVWNPNLATRGAYENYPFATPYVLQSYSAFFVTNIGKDTMAPYTHNFITFHEADKTLATENENLWKTTTSAFGPNSVQLSISSDNETIVWDKLLLFFNQQASIGLDMKDGIKIKNPNLDIYTVSDTNKFSVDFRPFALNSVIPIGLKTDSLKQYTFKVDQFDVNGGQLYFIDKLLNQVTPMAQGMTYTFNVDNSPLSQGSNRFAIGVGTTSVGQIAGRNMTLSLNPNPAKERVTISFDAAMEGKSTINICNIMGQNVYQQDLGNVSKGTIQVPVKDLSAGVYTVQITCGLQTLTQKLIIE